MIWETKLKFLLHMGLHPQKEKVQKGEAGASKWEVLDLEEAKPREFLISKRGLHKLKSLPVQLENP